MKTNNDTITAERVGQLLAYNPNTGEFKWRLSRGRSVMAVRKAGKADALGRITIRVNGTGYLAHRLAWLLTHGAWPAEQIDHINGDPGDNRIENLREATNSQNMRNKGLIRSNKSGYKGVSWCSRRQAWRAQAQEVAKSRHLGFFATAQEAGEAYKRHAREHHGEFIHSSLTQ